MARNFSQADRGRYRAIQLFLNTIAYKLLPYVQKILASAVKTILRIYSFSSALLFKMEVEKSMLLLAVFRLHGREEKLRESKH